jgi:hypothetical protein
MDCQLLVRKKTRFNLTPHKLERKLMDEYVNMYMFTYSTCSCTVHLHVRENLTVNMYMLM